MILLNPQALIYTKTLKSFLDILTFIFLLTLFSKKWAIKNIKYQLFYEIAFFYWAILGVGRFGDR